MKLKKLIAVFMSAATLAAMPVSPVLGDIWQQATVTAEAATTPTNYYKYTTGGICYELDTANKEAYIYSFTGKPTNLVVRATVNYANGAYKIVAIRDNAFNGCYTLNTVDLSSASNLRSIGQSAFRYSSVKYVYINSSVTVGQYAFANTSELQSATLQAYGQTVTVKPYAFADSAIQNFYGYAPKIYLQGYAFWHCFNLNYVHFNSNVQTLSLGNSLFCWLNNLKTVRIDGTNTQLYLEPSVFYSTGIDSITLPNTVTTIPEKCFALCRLKSFSMPDSVKSIGSKAFYESRLPAEFRISKNVVSIANDAFEDTKDVRKFTIDTSNAYYMTDRGVLFTKNGRTLLNYPQAKQDEEFETSAYYIHDYAIANNKSLKRLSIKNYTPLSGDTNNFPGLDNLEELIVSSSLSASTILSRFHILFGSYDPTASAKLHIINGQELLYTPVGKEPYFHPNYSQYICEHFDQFMYSQMIKDYTDKMEDWVISRVVSSNMTQIQKIMRLRKWIMDRVVYNPKTIADPGYIDSKDHGEASVFLHKETINGKQQYVTVCDGYAACYTNLLRKAGIDAETVKGGLHAWNLVKLNEKWYHMDICWDDAHLDYPESFPESIPFMYCLVPDSVVNDPDDDHNAYSWNVDNVLKKGVPVATMDNTKLGDVDGNGKFNTADVTKLKSYYGTTNAKYLALCDLNFDGKVNSTDARLLQDFVNTYYKQYDTPRIWRFSYYEQ